MRQIKFRGKRVDNDEWVYGSLIIRSLPHGNRYSILVLAEDEDEDDIEVPVYFPSVGQFSGLHDKNGKEIYEGDIIPFHGKNRELVFGDGCFALKGVNNPFVHINQSDIYFHNVEVIGNIHENPELLQQ